MNPRRRRHARARRATRFRSPTLQRRITHFAKVIMASALKMQGADLRCDHWSGHRVVFSGRYDQKPRAAG